MKIMVVRLTPQLVNLLSWHDRCTTACAGDVHAAINWIGLQALSPDAEPITWEETLDEVRAALAEGYGVELVAMEPVEEIMPSFGPDSGRQVYTHATNLATGEREEVRGLHPDAAGVAYQSYRVRFRVPGDLPFAALQAMAREAAE